MSTKSPTPDPARPATALTHPTSGTDAAAGRLAHGMGEGLWQFHRVHAPLISSAVHAGHGMRPEVGDQHRLPEEDRRREEDPFTDEFLPAAGSRIVVQPSRFEVDVNRPRDRAVYRTPEDAWGLDLWHDGAPGDDLVERSLARYDAFYRDLEYHLETLAAEWGKVVFFDVHSYNHRRGGPDAEPDDPQENPVINLGTGNLDRDFWAPVVDTFLEEMGRQRVNGEALDVRENVRFRGGHLSKWIARRFPHSVCPLAIEVKKVFMDEWTGEPDRGAIAQVRRALAATVPPVLEALRPVASGAVHEGAA